VKRDRSHLLTEKVNPRTADLDTLEPREILERIHAEDLRAFDAVGEVLDEIGRAAALIEEAFRSGGRLIYAGAGTSGRLGVLDAAECPPTFGSDPGMVVGVVAGGTEALVRSREGAEDRADDGAAAMADLGVGPSDVVLGIAAGSTTPYAVGALGEARRRGARTVLLACVPREDVEIAAEVDIAILPLTGPEVITGSTRMKAGTATKLVLNMLSTTAMVRIGKTYGNLMVDLRIGSEKLADRGRRIVRDLLQLPEAEAERLLESAGGSVKTALVMGRRKVGRAEAERLLDAAGGFLRRAWGEG
jgi:N-acetylmuramic acid 6-phosphate etherase